MSDTFIDEVNEELRRDRLFGFLRRWGLLIILGIVAIVGAAAYFEWSKARTQAESRAFGDAVIAAVEPEAGAERLAALQALSSDTEGGRAAILGLLASATALDEGDRPAALAALAAVEADAGLPVSYRQLATLKRVMIAGAELSVEERRALLQPLAAAGQVYRPLALEQLAMLELEAGNRAEALAGLTALLSEPELTPGLQARVQQMIVVLGDPSVEG